MLPYLGTQDVSLVVNIACFLLEVELNPVVESNDLMRAFSFTYKHVLEPTGVVLLRLPGTPVQLVVQGVCMLRVMAVVVSA